MICKLSLSQMHVLAVKMQPQFPTPVHSLTHSLTHLINHSLNSGGSRGDGVITPPPLNLCVTWTDHPPPWNVDDVTWAISNGGVCVLVNVQGGGVFVNFSEGG